MKRVASIRPPGPWERAGPLQTFAEGIEPDFAFQARVALQHCYNVADTPVISPAVSHGQAAHPAGIRLRIRQSEVRCGRLIAFRVHPAGYFAVLPRELRHSYKARQLVDRCVRLDVLIQLAEAVKAHQIKCIAQSSACWVGRVVAVEVLSALIDDRTAGRGAAGESIPVGHIRRRIDPWEKSLHRLIDVVTAAEGAHNAGLLQRVALLCCKFCMRLLRTGNLRPLCNVAPVAIHLQDTVRRQQWPVRILVDIFPVAAAGRPIHEPGRLKGGGIKRLHGWIEDLRRLARNGLVFVRRNRPVKWQEQPQPRGLRAVFACGIDAISAAKTFRPPEDIFDPAAGKPVQIQRH